MDKHLGIFLRASHILLRYSPVDDFHRVLEVLDTAQLECVQGVQGSPANSELWHSNLAALGP